MHSPCRENFNEFDKTEHGGYCQKCEKEVVDFSGMSKTELLKFFDGKAWTGCGHFRKDQLGIVRDPLIGGSTKFTWAAFIAGLLSLSPLYDTKSQKHKTEEIRTIDSPTFKSNTKELGKKMIKGVILDSLDLEPIPGATLILTHSGISTISNLDGHFQFRLFDWTNQFNKIDIYSHGYKMTSIQIPNSSGDINLGNIRLATLEDLEIVAPAPELKEIVVGGACAHPRGLKGFWWKIKNLFR